MIEAKLVVPQHAFRRTLSKGNALWRERAKVTEMSVKRLMLRVHPDVLGGHGEDVRENNLKSIQELSSLLSMTNDLASVRGQKPGGAGIPDEPINLQFYMEDDDARGTLKRIALQIDIKCDTSPRAWERDFLRALDRAFRSAGIMDEVTDGEKEIDGRSSRQRKRGTGMGYSDAYALHETYKSVEDTMEDALVWGIVDGAPDNEMRSDVSEAMLRPDQIEGMQHMRAAVIDELNRSNRILVSAGTRVFSGGCPPIYRDQFDRVHAALAHHVPLTYLQRLAAPLCGDMLIVMDTERNRSGTLRGRCIFVGVGMDVNEIADCIAESIAIAENVVGRFTDLSWPADH